MPEMLDDARSTDGDPEDLFEMADLPESDTGIDGIIYVSTATASHAPRVKWYPGRPHRDAARLTVTISDPPEARNLGLPPTLAERMAPIVMQWVTRNRTALLRFWTDGTSWTRQEVSAHLDALRAVTR